MMVFLGLVELCRQMHATFGTVGCVAAPVVAILLLAVAASNGGDR